MKLSTKGRYSVTALYHIALDYGKGPVSLKSISERQGVSDSYLEQLLYLTISCFVLAFGIWMQFRGKVAMLPGEAMNRAISEVTGKRYENIKIFFDIFNFHDINS